MQNFRQMSVEGRTRMLWGAHIFLYLAFIGWLASGDTAPFNGSKATAIVWLCLLVAHTLWIGFRQSNHLSYAEKPKRHRLELSDDGELVDVGEWEDTEKSKQGNVF